MIDKRKLIYKSGEKLFAQTGFKNTNVASIAKDANIAVGSFYSFYSSKEELFMQIFQSRNKRLKKKLLKQIDIDGKPLDVIKMQMNLNYKGMMDDAILRQWYDREVFQKIESKFVSKGGVEELNFAYDFFKEIIIKWQKEGRMRSDIDSEMIMAMFSALISIDLHKEDVGVKFFPEIMDYLAEFIISGLQKQ